MSERKHIVNPGTVDVDGVQRQVWVRIEYGNRLNPTHPESLSISGVEGPRGNGDCWGSCGQITLAIDKYNPGWNHSMVARLHETWQRWHLSGNRAGTPAQETFLREHAPEFPGHPIDHYDWAKAALTLAGLQPDTSVDPPYSYGSAWLNEEVPADVLDWLFALPAPSTECPWRNL